MSKHVGVDCGCHHGLPKAPRGGLTPTYPVTEISETDRGRRLPAASSLSRWVLRQDPLAQLG